MALYYVLFLHFISFHYVLFYFVAHICAGFPCVFMYAFNFIHGSGFTLRAIVIAFICTFISMFFFLSLWLFLYVYLYNFYLVHIENGVLFLRMFISHIISNICMQKVATIKTTKRITRKGKKRLSWKFNNDMKFQFNL